MSKHENEISFEDAVKYHPNEVKLLQEQAEKKLKKSKAKNKGSDISELCWYYELAVTVKSCGTLSDLINGTLSEEKEMSLEEEIKDSCKRTQATLCCAMNGAYAKETLNKLPLLIKNKIKEDIEKQHAEKARFDSLTPEQQRAEQDAILKELSRYSGFRAFSF